jgi:ABC-2 type transport system ATP-binding protein
MCDRVGIIEQGRLLAVGSVAEISSRVQVQSSVRVRLLQNIEGLQSWLGERSDISELHTDGDLATFSFQGDREAEAALLRSMIEAGFAVIEFGAKHKSLEDVFLHVTEGRVQ